MKYSDVYGLQVSGTNVSRWVCKHAYNIGILYLIQVRWHKIFMYDFDESVLKYISQKTMP